MEKNDLSSPNDTMLGLFIWKLRDSEVECVYLTTSTLRLASEKTPKPEIIPDERGRDKLSKAPRARFPCKPETQLQKPVELDEI